MTHSISLITTLTAGFGPISASRDSSGRSVLNTLGTSIDTVRRYSVYRAP